jgi:hypothetical protein
LVHNRSIYIFTTEPKPVPKEKYIFTGILKSSSEKAILTNT